MKTFLREESCAVQTVWVVSDSRQRLPHQQAAKLAFTGHSVSGKQCSPSQRYLGSLGIQPRLEGDLHSANSVVTEAQEIGRMSGKYQGILML